MIEKILNFKKFNRERKSKDCWWFFLILLVMFFSFFLSTNQAQATLINLKHFSDEISNSSPGGESDHLIKFQSPLKIESNWRVEISFSQEFYIPDSFNVYDLDLATGSSLSGPFLNRNLSTSSNEGTDKVEITKGYGGKIVFLVDSSSSIPQDSWIQIKIGKNANFGGIGVNQIVNPTTTGSFLMRVNVYDSSGSLRERNETIIATVNPVGVGVTAPPDTTPPERYNGQPQGSIPANTQNVSLSLDTNEWAYCRYATEPGIEYASMTNAFSDTPKLHHAVVISNLENGVTYHFYVRCKDTKDNVNTDDYLIAFTVSAPPSNPPGSGGGGGGGGGAPYPPPPSSPSLQIKGVAYPDALITVLKDGKEEKTGKADKKGNFSFTISGLEQGVYTFGVRAKDSKGRESITDTATISIRAGTYNLISVVLPPTIELSTNTVEKSQPIEIFGESAPTSNVEVWVYPPLKEGEKLNEEDIVKMRTTSSDLGEWRVTLDTSYLKEKQTYQVKAKVAISSSLSSEFGKVVYFGVGTVPKANLGNRADINKDGKVNLVDFSILLYYWNTSEPKADINLDGKVNLVDFSIMMYYWTG